MSFLQLAAEKIAGVLYRVKYCRQKVRQKMCHKISVIKTNSFDNIKETRIFGAYGPIMFALWVWVDFGASWKGGPLCENCSFLSIPT